MAEFLSESRRHHDNWMKANGRRREGGHDRKVARAEVGVCETAQDRVVSWNESTRRKRWSKEQMGRGRKGRRWVSQESSQQGQNWKSPDIQHICDLLIFLGLLKGASLLQSKIVKPD